MPQIYSQRILGVYTPRFYGCSTIWEGAARALIAEVAEWARARNCSRVYWSTQETNATARRLYDQVALNRGFILYQINL